VTKATPVVAAVLVAPCLDFVRTWHYAEQQQRHPVYRQVLTNNLRVCAARHRDNDVRVMTCVSRRLDLVYLHFPFLRGSHFSFSGCFLFACLPSYYYFGFSLAT
jgi:hypothetical protein